MRLELFHLILVDILNVKAIFWTFFLIFYRNVFKKLFKKNYKINWVCPISWKMWVWMCLCLLRGGAASGCYMRCVWHRFIYEHPVDACNTPAERKPSHNTFKCSDVKEKTVSERYPTTLWKGQNNYEKLRNFVHWENLSVNLSWVPNTILI